MQRVMSVSMSPIPEEEEEEPPPETTPPPPSSPSYNLFSRRFLRLHGRDLFASSASWFLVDLVFYTSTLLLSHIFNLSSDNPNPNLYDIAFGVAKLSAIIAACSTIPGYWFTVYFIDRIGRVRIQLLGFFFMAVVYLVVGIPYSWYWGKHQDTDDTGFMVLYGLVFFFSNFGPNTTTFIVPAELFPARFRSTCHGISGAVGKLGAIVGTVGFLWVTKTVRRESDGVKNFPDVNRMRVAFLILGGVCVLGIAVTYFFTCETKGRSLEENELQDESQVQELLRRQTCSRPPSARQMT